MFRSDGLVPELRESLKTATPDSMPPDLREAYLKTTPNPDLPLFVKKSAKRMLEFKDWPDLMQRVKGVKEKKAQKLSAEGLTVNGKAFDGAAPASSKEAKEAKAPKAAKP